MNNQTYSAKKVGELKALLKEKGLAVSGVKKDLVARLVLAENSTGGRPVTVAQAGLKSSGAGATGDGATGAGATGASGTRAGGIASFGLPEGVVESYRKKGISSMFPWQEACLQCGSGAPLAGGNLVYSAPTSAGKTLVAEILMIKRVLATGRKALLILPFIALAREKMVYLQGVLASTGLRVGGFMATSSPSGGLRGTDIAVATIERANGLVNRMMEENQLQTLSCVVVDELHMVGDPSRGFLLELLLTKVLYSAGPSVQLVGMSATLPNLADLARWLRSSLYTTDFRPVPLTQLVKVGDSLLDTSLMPVGRVLPSLALPHDTEHLTWLCLQTVLEGHSVLLFCPTKAWVEKLAESLAQDFFSLCQPGPDGLTAGTSLGQSLRAELATGKLEAMLGQLSNSPAGLDSSLARLLQVAVAFHHAGLTTEEREIVETGFRSQGVRVLVATSTLSSGMNLPARRVIVRCPTAYHGRLMDKLQYQQMVGRAGRKGIDTRGESILLCKPQEREKVRGLVSGRLEPVISCLGLGPGDSSSAMKRALLEVVVSGAANCEEQVQRWAQCTLMAAQCRDRAQHQVIPESIAFLQAQGFLQLRTAGDRELYEATRLGLACLSSSLGPEEALAIYKELGTAKEMVEAGEELHLLHILFMTVSVSSALDEQKLDWMSFLCMWESFSEDIKKVGELVGVGQRFMVKGMQGVIKMTDPQQKESLGVHRRFYTALALQDRLQEASLTATAARFGATKGQLQGVQQAASTFLHMVTVFCQRLSWRELARRLGQLQDRLEYGVPRELTELCRLASVTRALARTLHDAGLRSVALLSIASTEEVKRICAAADGQTAAGTGVTEEWAAKIVVEAVAELQRRPGPGVSALEAEEEDRLQELPTQGGDGLKRKQEEKSSGWEERSSKKAKLE